MKKKDFWREPNIIKIIDSDCSNNGQWAWKQTLLYLEKNKALLHRVHVLFELEELGHGRSRKLE